MAAHGNAKVHARRVFLCRCKRVSVSGVEALHVSFQLKQVSPRRGRAFFCITDFSDFLGHGLVRDEDILRSCIGGTAREGKFLAS